MNLVRLPVEGAANLRDLGGYPTSYESSTKWKKILRSDCMSRLTEHDKEYLINEYKLKTIIDLRSEDELISAPNALRDDNRVNYFNVSLSDSVDPNDVGDIIKNGGQNFLEMFYIDLLENRQKGLKHVLKLILDTPDDSSVVFHCTAGKDRTGVIAMLILGICGVSRQDISTNYMTSATNLQYSQTFNETIKQMLEHYIEILGEDVMKKMSGSNVESIEHTYDKFIEKYESFDNYFILLGFSDSEIKKFKKKFTCKK